MRVLNHRKIRHRERQKCYKDGLLNHRCISYFLRRLPHNRRSMSDQSMTVVSLTVLVYLYANPIFYNDYRITVLESSANNDGLGGTVFICACRQWPSTT